MWGSGQLKCGQWTISIQHVCIQYCLGAVKLMGDNCSSVSGYWTDFEQSWLKQNSINGKREADSLWVNGRIFPSE